MEKGEKIQREKIEIGKPGYLNESCWLVKTLNYSPYKRCQYCELKFRNCLFLHYQIISSILILFFLTLSFLIEGKNSKLLIISVFTLVIVYGYFFNKSTDKIIKANFAQRKANEALGELTKNLQQKVDEQTKEIRKAYEVEKKAHKELQRLDEAKSQFIIATQHHLRTPLTSMKGYIDLILGGSYGKVPRKLKETALKFQASTNRLIRIVNEFLDISQLQLGKKVVFLKPNIKIEPILKEIIEELKFEADNKGLHLKLKKPKREIPVVKADSEKLKVALFNIVDNAVKYTGKGGITIEVKKSDDKLHIMVRDTGIGIPKEELRVLFSRVFERGKKAKKIFTTGRGIGLFIASHIIETHHGKVWAESEGRSKGSTFYIELPIRS